MRQQISREGSNQEAGKLSRIRLEECIYAACMYAIRTPGQVVGIRQAAAATHRLQHLSVVGCLLLLAKHCPVCMAQASIVWTHHTLTPPDCQPVLRVL